MLSFMFLLRTMDLSLIWKNYLIFVKILGYSKKYFSKKYYPWTPTTSYSVAQKYSTAHNRQQAVGTMQIAYKCDCKVYLRKTITLPDNKTVINPGYLSLQMLGYY